eukprot:6791902-Prorocentrum_lima.AAC.1
MAQVAQVAQSSKMETKGAFTSYFATAERRSRPYMRRLHRWRCLKPGWHSCWACWRRLSMNCRSFSFDT